MENKLDQLIFSLNKNMQVHKLYVDSRARKEGSHADFSWQPDRPILVETSRAFIDSVHLPVVWDTIGADNNKIYVSEQLPLLTAANGINKLYLLETTSGGTNYRIIQLDNAIYDGPNLRTNLESKLTAAGTLATGWTVTYTSDNLLGTMTIQSQGLTSWKLFSRRELISLNDWGGISLTKTALEDACDLFDIVETSALSSNQSSVLTLLPALFYRQVTLATGFYTFDELTTEMQSKLNTNTEMGANTYTVSPVRLTGRIQVTNTSRQQFTIYPESYLLSNAFMFPGVGTTPYSSDNVTGLQGDNPLVGNTVSGFMHVNVLKYHTLFITCSLGTHNDSVGPVSQSTIARKVIIDQPSGGMVNDFHSLPYDYVSLDKQSISAISFRLTDWRGRTVTMTAPWSLSLVIVPEDQF